MDGALRTEEGTAVRMGLRSTALLGFVALIATACPSDSVGGGRNTLADVKSRGELRCGVNGQVPGFSFVQADGTIAGFDAEFCRAVAAAVLGDATAVSFEQLTAEQRFPALQSNDIDVLIRNTTFTASRDGSESLSFVTTTF